MKKKKNAPEPLIFRRKPKKTTSSQEPAEIQEEIYDRKKQYQRPQNQYQRPQNQYQRPWIKEKYNMKIVYRFTCSRCEKEDELSYVPRTTEGALCHECAKRVLGGKWRGDERHPEEHEFNCTVCGTKAWLTNAPEDDRLLLCEPCLRGQHRSKPKRVQGHWLDPDGGVKKKPAKQFKPPTIETDS